MKPTAGGLSAMICQSRERGVAGGTKRVKSLSPWKIIFRCTGSPTCNRFVDNCGGSTKNFPMAPVKPDGASAGNGRTLMVILSETSKVYLVGPPGMVTCPRMEMAPLNSRPAVKACAEKLCRPAEIGVTFISQMKAGLSWPPMLVTSMDWRIAVLSIMSPSLLSWRSRSASISLPFFAGSSTRTRNGSPRKRLVTEVSSCNWRGADRSEAAAATSSVAAGISTATPATVTVKLVMIKFPATAGRTS